jgi:predicted DNA-binding WGR domain protein
MSWRTMTDSRVDGLVLDGKWNILVNTTAGHNKFWAFRGDGIENVKVRYGKVGTNGIADINYGEYKFWVKFTEKRGKGYRFATDAELKKYFNDKVLQIWEV